MIKKAISNYLIKRGFKRLTNQIAKLDANLTAEELVEFLFSKDAELITPWQFKEELMGLAKILEQKKPKVVLEIGTANGGTLFLSTRLAANDALIMSVDLPGGKFGGGYPDWKTPIYKSFAKTGQTINLIRASSHDEETFNNVKANLAGRKIDYLFIDGDHTYEGVKLDFEKYVELVAKDGIIGMHDIVVHPKSACNVFEFWNEIKLKFEYKEFINDQNQGKFGVGILYNR